jgi:signal transduction histidine kinase
LILITVFGIFFALFVIAYENYTYDKRRESVVAYAGVISNSLWHLEAYAPTDYLTLIVDEQDYERIKVIRDDGFDFVDIQNKHSSGLTNTLVALKLIRRIEISADINYKGEVIGKINAIWLNKNIFTYFYALIVVILLAGIFLLYWRILQSNRELEIGVQKRTVELRSANIELKENEARYRSIFEDSPIALREEDFTGVKQIIDGLRAKGVVDFQTYFDQHPETVAACVQAVKVINVNQNTLELFKTDSKDRLYQGLTDIFSEESLVSFTQQLMAFAQGQTHFECETVQQMVTGEKFWAATSVSIAPGYEQTWEKEFVSILDITKRKQAETELANYREHLEDLVAARTRELVALQHDLERRVTERTEELAQVNIGLNAEITERKRLQEKVQRYTEELEQRVADRTRELSVLYDVTAVASNVLDLDELLSCLLDRSLSAIRRKAGIIHLVDETSSTLHLNTQQDVSDAISNGIAAFYSVQGEVRKVLEGHSSFIITDLINDLRVPQVVRQSGWRTYIGEPIQDTRGRLLGILSIFDDTGHPLSVEELTLLASIADHIGLAVENVRLRRQAGEAAVLEDRQRLARELHDSVNQSLFSASVIAETLPRLWDRNPMLVQEYLGDLHRLIRGALAEMRILLLELRPVSMADAVLGDLLHQLVDGVKGRTQLDIALQIQGQGEIPTRVKKNLFRIAQEALNNVVKHARAKQVTLMFNQNLDQITLRICDDGQGFAVGEVESGHLGLQIMRERVEEIGANLSVLSGPGAGTEISVTLPLLNKLTS